MNYFENSSKDESLLHTWSLGVEEQFYIFFPIFFLFLLNFNKHNIKTIFIISLASFLLCIYQVALRPNLAFYMLPLRAWEFGAGVMCALYMDSYKDRQSFITNDIKNYNLDLIGIILILFSSIMISNGLSHPSSITLLPVLGACMIILFGHKYSIAGRLLSSRPFIFLGLISYSLYLWHQPILTSMKIVIPSFNNPLTKILLVTMIVVISYFTWRYVETPFRNKKSFLGKNFYKMLLTLSSVLIFIFALTINLNGFEKYFSKNLSKDQINLIQSYNFGPYEKLKNNNCYIHTQEINKLFLDKFKDCSENNKATIIIGDSHAMDIYNSLALNSENEFLVGISRGGCRVNELSNNCHYTGSLDFIKKNQSKIKKL